MLLLTLAACLAFLTSSPFVAAASMPTAAPSRTPMTVVSNGNSLYFSRHADAQCAQPSYAITTPRNADGTKMAINRCLSKGGSKFKFLCKLGSNGRYTVVQQLFGSADDTCSSTAVSSLPYNDMHGLRCQPTARGDYVKIHCGEDSSALLSQSAVVSPQLFSDERCVEAASSRRAQLNTCTPHYHQGAPDQKPLVDFYYKLSVSSPASASILALTMTRYDKKDDYCNSRVVGRSAISYAAVPNTAPAVPQCVQDPLHPTLYYRLERGKVPYATALALSWKVPSPAPTPAPSSAPSPAPTPSPSPAPYPAPSPSPSPAPTPVVHSNAEASAVCGIYNQQSDTVKGVLSSNWMWDCLSGSGNPCGSPSWTGATCSTGVPKYMTKFTLTDLNLALAGSLPSSLGLLTGLTWLELSGRGFVGSLPSELGLMTNLLFLFLQSNSLTNSLPTQLGQLTALQWFFLLNNSLQGQLPTELGQMASVQWVQIGSNSLSGAAPSKFCDLGASFTRDSIVTCPAPTPAPSPAPTPAPSPAPSPAVIAYTITRAAPEWDSNQWKFANIAVADEGLCWNGPDQQSGSYASGGNSDFYFVLDMGRSCSVDSLKFKPCIISENQWCSYYQSLMMDVSVSNDGTSFGTTVSITAEQCGSGVQTLTVGLTGRYIKVLSKTYAQFSSGADYIAPYGWCT